MNFFNVLLLFHLLRYLEGMRVSLHGTPHDGKDTRSVMLTLVPCICIVKKEGDPRGVGYDFQAMGLNAGCTRVGAY